MKGHKEVFKALPYIPSMHNLDKIWSVKYFVFVDEWKKSINLHDITTLECVRVIQSPHIKPWKIKSNHDQSVFICQGWNHEFSIIKGIVSSSDEMTK